MEKDCVKFPVCSGQDLEASLERVTEQVMGVGTPPITDRETAYALHIEFDRIRDVLMLDRTVWEQYQYLYWWKKYHSYQMVSDRLDESLKGEHLERMRQEFKRAMQLGQLRQSDFTASQWRDIRRMIDQARGYTGARGLLRKAVRHIPGWARRGILGAVNLAAKTKRMIVGGKR